MTSPENDAIMSADEARLYCEAGPGVGLGHVARCLAVAEALEEDGLCPVFITGSGGADALGWMAPGRFPVRAADAHGDSQSEDPCAVAVMDDYGLDRARMEAIGSRARVAVVIDDMADRELAGDLVVNPAAGTESGAYADAVARGARILLGPAFAPIRADVWSRRAHGLIRRIAGEPESGSLLVTAGGLDGRGLAPAFLSAALDATAANNRPVDVALGGQALSWPDIDVIAAQHPTRVRTHRDARDMAQLYAGADVSVGPGGVALLEKLCLGVPTLAVIVAENQRSSVEGLASLGCIASVDATTDGKASEHFQTEVQHALDELLGSVTKRADMWRRGAALVDGLGARRIVLAARPETNRDNAPVTLRKFTAKDEGLLLAWQREPGMRRHFRDPAVPEPSDHQAWCAARLTDPFGVCEIIVVDDRPVGMVRFDPASDETHEAPGEVSVLVSGSEQGKGTGSAALMTLRRLLRERPMRAEIHPANEASQGSFRRAGFVSVSANCLAAAALAVGGR
jgi:UDP-2,4-diacetamido-2,4,6-trideoxy-beta-L-altropyranose hydrolase